MFQPVSLDAPISVPVTGRPRNTTAGSGPPMVVQIRRDATTVAPAGMLEIVPVPPAGAPTRCAMPMPSDAMSRPTPEVERPPRSPVSAIRVPAERTRMRGLTTPLRASVIGLPVDCSAFRTVGTSAEGLMPFRTAQAPATCGVAIEVPLRTANPPPGTDELIEPPGASSSTSGDELENEETVSFFSVEPTVIADEMHAGKLTAFVKPLLPD